MPSYMLNQTVREHEIKTLTCNESIGIASVTGDDGQTAVIGAGESLVIPAGFKGVFEVIEPVTKHYVISSRQ